MLPSGKPLLSQPPFRYDVTLVENTSAGVANSMFAKKRPTKNTSVSRCTRCSAEICLKTDPKYSDYECEKGATRYYKRVKLAEETEERFNRLVEREETEQVKMTDLEARTLETKRELAIEDGLDEI